MYAYAGKILRVDLSNNRITTESTEKYAREFLGGRGINQWILFREVKQSVNPFDPANRLIFGTGVLVGTLAPATCRHNVDSKNVFTGGIGSANSGGHFGPELKFGGYDHIIIEGRCQSPCYLWISDDKVEIKDAKDLWGKTTWQTEDIIKEEIGDKSIQIASIGPAGENLVRAACIINNRSRAAGRCGLGAVMGSKNLKAVAVKGTKEVTVARPDEFMKLIEEIWEKIMSDEDMKRFRQWGGTSYIETYNEISGLCVRNFQNGFWSPGKIEKISKKELDGKYAVRRLACFACPVGCSRYLKITSGEFIGVEGEGFQSAFIDFGTKLDIDYLPAITKAHVLCSQYGLDSQNTGGVIAWAFECYQRGILTKQTTDGVELDWGNYSAMLELIRKIAFREGFGDLLAEGSARASEKIGSGSEKYVMTMKGQELWEFLRAAKGWALGVITSPIGGGHMRGAPLWEFKKLSREEGEKFFGVPTAGDRNTYEGKAKLVIYTENFKAIVDCLGLCYFVTQRVSPYIIGPEDLAKLFSAATGRSTTVEELMKIGERISNVERLFNVRAGMTRKDDIPPARCFEPVKSGPAKGQLLERKKLLKMLDEYYTLRGWNAEGVPTIMKLKELGLQGVLKEESLRI